ncbi:MAG: Zn-ribbon OB-fold protein [Glaciihabitans sp.]|jgi:uncharacterized OB-fold protein|nr:Zn-ribbon OB-fold protein [Glaciihabitans sp.]
MVNVVPYPEARPFWEGVAQGELRLQRCQDCGRAVFYPRALCPYCHGDRLGWFVASGSGTVYSYTTVHRGFGEFAGQAPYSLAVIDLDEGPRMLSRIVGDVTVSIDARVQVEIARFGDHNSMALPYFRVLRA